jgi:hypothetical protein
MHNDCTNVLRRMLGETKATSRTVTALAGGQIDPSARADLFRAEM